MLTMTQVIQWCQQHTGYPRFKFMEPNEMRQIIQSWPLRDFSQAFPYKTLYQIIPQEDAVDPSRFPGLFYINPTDAPASVINEIGMAYTSACIANGGYPRDMGRTIYGGAVGIGAILHNQLIANMASMVQPQQVTTEFHKPNMVQLHPKRMFYGMQTQVFVELICKHDPNLTTIPEHYWKWFCQLSEWYIKGVIFERYKDWDDETVAGHQVRTKIQDFSDYESKIQDLCTTMDEETIKDYNRIDFYVV